MACLGRYKDDTLRKKTLALLDNNMSDKKLGREGRKEGRTEMTRNKARGKEEGRKSACV